MALSGLEIARMAAEFKNSPAPAKPAAAKPAGRVKVVAGTKKIGDTINGHTITGFGKTWSQFIADHETSAWGLAPGKNYRLDVQYAYFN
jgi:hypothetical protein